MRPRELPCRAGHIVRDTSAGSRSPRYYGFGIRTGDHQSNSARPLGSRLHLLLNPAEHDLSGEPTGLRCRIHEAEELVAQVLAREHQVADMDVLAFVRIIRFDVEKAAERGELSGFEVGVAPSGEAALCPSCSKEAVVGGVLCPRDDLLQLLDHTSALRYSGALSNRLDLVAPKIKGQRRLLAVRLALRIFPGHGESEIGPYFIDKASLLPPHALPEAGEDLFIGTEVCLVDEAPQRLRQVNFKVDISQHSERDRQNNVVGLDDLSRMYGFKILSACSSRYWATER
jgi:hypothetical protein